MKTIKNHKLSSISWLSSLNGEGYVKNFYEPESIQELQELCSYFFTQGLDFDLIGHTSNTLYNPDYVCERMVSTRKLNNYEIKQDCIVCECGTSVRQLSIASIKLGIMGFEGLIDLPGTIAASVYGNAGCYGCSISSLLRDATILTDKGSIETVGKEWFAFGKRTTVLKRGEKKAVILKITLNRENGEIAKLEKTAEQNHAIRKKTQPEANNSLGSIFVEPGKPTLVYTMIAGLSRLYGLVLRMIGYSCQIVNEKQKHLMFRLLRATDIEPYVRHWNWYQWRDAASYELFWKYVKLHRRLFTSSEFEIEIKENQNSCFDIDR